MKKIVKRTLWSLCLLLILASSLILFFTFTTTGLKSFIRLAGVYSHHQIAVEGLVGRLRDQLQLAELNIPLENRKLTIKNAELKWQLSSIIHHELPMKFHAEVVEIEQDGTIYRFNNINLTALYKDKRVQISDLSAHYSDVKIVGKLKLNTEYPYAFTSTLKLQNKGNPAGLLSVAGDAHLIHWTGDFHGPGTLSLQGSLSELTQLNQIIKWRDFNWPDSPTQETLSKEGRITMSGTLPQLNIELFAKINRTAQELWQIHGTIHGTLPWSWNWHINLLSAESSLKQAGLYTNLVLTGELTSANEGQLSLKIAPGHYQLPAGSALSTLLFKGGSINASLSPKGLNGAGELGLDDNKNLNVQFKLPKLSLSEGINSQQKFSSKLSLAVSSFDFLPALIPDLKNPKGNLIVSLLAHGTVYQPQLTTKVSLQKGSVEIPTLGIQLHSINGTINGQKDNWEGTVSLNSGNQALVIQGRGLSAPQFSTDLTLEGNNIPVIHTDNYQVNVSPKLHIKYQQGLLDIAGSVLVPYAQIKVQSFSNSLSLSNDVVYQSKEQNYSSPIQTQMDVQVEMGEQVELTAKGLHATLSGTVNVKQSPQSAMSATGELNVVQGEYKAYGQNLSIEQGELFFTGGAIDNPGINLRASKNINTTSTGATGNNQLLDFNNNNAQNANLRGNITVGVEVTGRLTEPEIQLFSTPAILSQADILSMLVLGRPASQANKSGGQLLLAAISSMNLGGNSKGTQMLSQLKQSLGVDFNVETNSNYNLLTNTVSDKTAFVVSKSLSKRISLSYNVGLSQADPNVVTLKYLINKFFSIQVNSSTTNSGIDVLYTSSKK